MKIAVPFENGQVFQHFGRSAQFKLYEAENGQLVRAEVVPTEGQGHGCGSHSCREDPGGCGGGCH